MEIREYETAEGRSPFGEWFDDLDPVAAAKITGALARLGQGNTSNVKSVGAGIAELRIDFGPGYRIYFGREGASLLILVGGGTKKRQQRDVVAAQARWQAYKLRRKGKV